MKNPINKICVICGIIAVMGCNSNEQPEQKTETPAPPQEQTLCFLAKGDGKTGEEGIPDTHIQLTIQGDSVKAISDDYKEMNGIDVTFSGIRKGDTLFLLCVCPDGPDGMEFYNDERIFLLQPVQLSQLETISKNGKTILKNSTKPKIILTYNKVNCK